MPVKRFQRNAPSPLAQQLKDRLVREWRNPDPQAAEPIVLEESTGPNQPIHLYVVWEDWAPLPQIERSDVIMDAFEEAHPNRQNELVTVAMGLTRAEATRLGIRF